ncbi:hypothetical protein K437DRAFT_295624 [Tilletiaria anomala UBC 951]|uniref:CUE domain-containing protein n=1 Tax=Tilletiaria anomala (strain ATCC 24038 / CBS 436.72 / UBC 951) TaxID=1037660 RepID=A0A066VHX0_TILAU|nr:uncharacterized protein K437DRAFT_295624 [Tilletiaria anomala UBC 951]KDN41317.1 hypothetical protein K437DRAFT_295624 [Tilletiaria anomala UBC 951]
MPAHEKKGSSAGAIDLSALGDALGEGPDTKNDRAKTDTDEAGYTIGDDSDSSPAEATGGNKDKQDREAANASTLGAQYKVPKLPITGGEGERIKSNIAVIRHISAEERNRTQSTQDQGQGNSFSTLLQTSARSNSPSADAPAGAVSAVVDVPGTEHAQGGGSDVDTLIAMFPDLPRDTISDILSAHSNNVEQTANILLGMNDSSAEQGQQSAGTRAGTDRDGAGSEQGAASNEQEATRNDEALARALMQQEQEALALEREQHLRSQQQLFESGGGRGGGSVGSVFGFGRAQQDQQQQQPKPERTYDVNTLNYQPRVRRGNSAQGAPAPVFADLDQQHHTYQQQHHWQKQKQQLPSSQQQQQRPAGHMSRPGGVLPGNAEAKQWSEDINRFAEAGIARAASTFSSLKARANAALAERRQQGAQQHQQLSNGQTLGTSGSITSPATGNQNQQRSPALGSAGAYDRDPAPVGDEELAKILAVSGNGGGGGAPQLVARNLGGTFASSTSKPFLERYGGGSHNGADGNTGARAAARTPVRSNSGAGAGADTETGKLSGWDAVGRTGEAVQDASAATPIPSAPAGRIAIHDNTAKVAAASAGIGLAAGAALNADENDGSDSDLEYVANPFEDEE